MRKILLSLITFSLLLFSNPIQQKTNTGLASAYMNDEPQTVDIFEQPWEFFDRVLATLDLPPEYLEPNAYVGLHWDAASEDPQDTSVCDEFGRLYLLWTSEKSHSALGISEIKCNGVVYKHIYPSGYHRYYETISWGYGNGTYLHATTIYVVIDDEIEYGVDINNSKFDIEYFKAGLDSFYADDPTGEYEFHMNKEANFDFKVKPQVNGRDILQLCALSYTIIEDCIAQSYYDIGFGGYYHQVYFNTPIDIDRVYRVDVSYKLDSEERDWWELWANKGEISVVKSLTTEVVGGGFFGLGRYQGFEEGYYHAQGSNAQTYKYKLHLNYDSNAWNWFDFKTQPEEKYQKISDFKVLRLNFIMDGQEYDLPIYMDTVDGTTVSVFDPSLIGDPDDLTIKDVFDMIQEFFEKFWDAIVMATKIIGILLLIVAAMYVIGFVGKLIGFIYHFIKGVPIPKFNKEPKQNYPVNNQPRYNNNNYKYPEYKKPYTNNYQTKPKEIKQPSSKEIREQKKAEATRKRIEKIQAKKGTKVDNTKH